MSKKELYQINIQPHALDACEIIRDRFYIEDEYNIINLNKEPESSFFVKITNLIRGHAEGEGSAHFSWRKHDRSRPLVTSVFTYVDVTKCNCRPAPSAAAKEEDRTVTVALPPIDPKDVIGVPPSSWCRCPRYWVIAVNYELSTPSGSRCSEQNAMGKLASIGTPTWGVREVFVHGNNPKKESNPLFPCGVCENMLQKVNKDIFNRYGEDAVLYMYDATKPHKLVSLPFPEISHRDGNSFKQFVSQDLRSGVLQD
ncbi:A distinct subfamily of CDD/CDA-like deaminases, putative [Angomonas deanei]|uniref:A distinct subfamily of CDD/CDA-like deaminases, putative n=1 Tax=Angomonas deanei TaxID=59799 RepID=A0A7G2C099_9TRYP|nr:A distinct subfamily of CDD/CDA-like deaminases, putative [Angomonas deanei]